MIKNKFLSVKDITRKNIGSWLNNTYNFAMSDAAHTMVFTAVKESKPFHVMSWSPDLGSIYLRVVDSNRKAVVEYQLSNTGRLSPSQWVVASTFGDYEAELKDDFHLINGLRQEFRKSLGVL